MMMAMNDQLGDSMNDQLGEPKRKDLRRMASNAT
jgi:hypothetical protein